MILTDRHLGKSQSITYTADKKQSLFAILKKKVFSDQVFMVSLGAEPRTKKLYHVFNQILNYQVFGFRKE